MARTRNLKPGFFKNEDLAMLAPLTRLLFAGLWCWADRDGRLEDRPKRLKAEILPYDDCDVDEMLRQLVTPPGRFITRYEVEGQRYIGIPQFRAHQNPHQAEKSSGIPAPPDKHGASTVQAPDKHSSKRALTLNPSSLTLNPSSLPKGRESAAPPLSSDDDPPSLTVEAFVKQWNSLKGVCPCKNLTKRRREAFRARCKDAAWLENLPEALRRIAESGFCAGQNDRGWKASVDWFLRPDTVVKLIEGAYQGSKNDGRQRGTVRRDSAASVREPGRYP